MANHTFKHLFIAALAAATFDGFAAEGASAPASSTAAFAAPSAADLIPASVPPPAPALTDAVDFDALRLAFGRRVDFYERCEHSLPLKAWTDATVAKNYADAYEIATAWLAQCPVGERVHLWAASSAQSMNNVELANLHKRWFVGLTDSVLRSGDGKTPQTPWVTISIPEEYAVLTRFGLRSEMQTLLAGGIDQLTTRPIHGGDTVILYFNPAWSEVRLRNELKPKAP